MTSITSFDFAPGNVKKATVGISSSDLWKWPVDKINVVDGFNVREKNAEYNQRVRAIATSILENGYMADKPLAGYITEQDGENIMVLIDGHTRYDAVKLAISEGAEIETLPVVTKPRGTSMEDLTVALYTSNTGEKLTPYELAKLCKRLLGFGLDEGQIAKRFGLTRAYVVDMLNLLAAPKKLRDMVTEGTVSATEATKAVKAHGSKAADVLDTAVKESGKTRITSKDIKKSVNAVPATVKRAAEYLNRPENKQMIHPSVIALLSHVTGAPDVIILSTIGNIVQE